MERARRHRLIGACPVDAHARLTGKVFLAALVCVALAGCPSPRQSFSGLLAKIDASKDSAAVEVYRKAATLAASTEDRLRLLKRAMRRGPEFASGVAKTVVASGIVSEPVARAALDVFLDAGRFDDALSLFDGSLDAHTHGAELAEAVVRSYHAGVTPRLPADGLVACFDATGDSSFMILAAIDAMLAGDRATAFSVLQNVTHVPYRLLWDAGDTSSLAELAPSTADPLEMAVCADAAHIVGLDAVATQLYATLLDTHPSWSWKPYEALARIAAAGSANSALVWPHTPRPDSYAALSSPGAVEDRLYGLMAERFPDSDAARIEQARRLFSQGRAAEVSKILSSIPGEAGAIARLQYGDQYRSVPLALNLAATYGSSPAALDAALSALASTGTWGRFKEILDRTAKAGIETPRSWFWSGLAMTLDGDLEGAAAAIRAGGPASSGYAGALDLGIMELAASRPSAAIDALMIAVGMARSDEEMTRAYLLLGDACVACGMNDRAAAAYRKVLDIDPASRAARSRLERIK
jgi:tetratricopeptide (TPR) repeat protein